MALWQFTNAQRAYIKAVLDDEVKRMAREAKEYKAKIARGEIPHPLAKYPEMRAAAERGRIAKAPNQGRSDSAETLLDEDYFLEGG